MLLLGGVLFALALTEGWVTRWPLSPALIYLAVGWVAGVLSGALADNPAADPTGAPDAAALIRHASALTHATEWALLISLFAVGLRLLVPPTWRAWRVALLLAGPGMVVTIALAAIAAYALLDLPWAAALLLASVVAPTDPVLASEVQIQSTADRDAVRLSLTAEGGLNDGTALPAVMLALGLLGLHNLGDHAVAWWWADFVWPIGGGAAVGAALGYSLGWAVQHRLRQRDAVTRDELIYVGAVALSFGLARALEVSTFVVAFAAGATLLLPLRRLAQGAAVADSRAAHLTERLHQFGARIERLIEAAMVLAVGAALYGVGAGWRELGFALLLLAVVRPAAVLAVVRKHRMPAGQRRLVGWFGIRGIGSIFYLVFALEHGVVGPLAHTVVSATLSCVALSIVLHGLSATPLMNAYRRKRMRRPGKPVLAVADASDASGSGTRADAEQPQQAAQSDGSPPA